ncbi:jg17705 [Pararge aegeria aegeria]|uniref:Jg17705 protein n=1 Tax=Pararge aegeria aegeria TaxID=348720 RepID=A0A8S4R5Z5_9NEOP|nr:jg17705 [Pararge aegeria aegeria]
MIYILFTISGSPHRYPGVESTMTRNPPLQALLPEEALSLQAGVGVALLSGFFFFISYMGFYGALTGSQFLLFMRGIQEPNSFTTHALRLALRCCEQNFTRSPPDSIAPPWSCCAEAYPKNCTFEQVYTVVNITANRPDAVLVDRSVRRAIIVRHYYST